MIERKAYYLLLHLPTTHTVIQIENKQLFKNIFVNDLLNEYLRSQLKGSSFLQPK